MLDKVGVEIEDVVHTKEAIRVQLQREFKKNDIYLPTAISYGSNISQQYIEDRLFYAESLFIQRSDWALKSRQIKRTFFLNINYLYLVFVSNSIEELE